MYHHVLTMFCTMNIFFLNETHTHTLRECCSAAFDVLMLSI